MPVAILALVVSFVGIAAYFSYPFLLTVDRPEIIVSAAFSIVGTSVAALAAFALWSIQHAADVKRADETDRQRQKRILVALRQELLLNLEAQNVQFGKAGRARLRPRLLHEVEAAGPDEHSMPMGVAATENAVYDAIKAEIMDLPEEVISPVVRYYQFDENIAGLLLSFANGKFEKVSKERRKRAIEQLFVVGEEAVENACSAFQAVHKALGSEPAHLARVPNQIQDAISDSSDDNDGGAK